jgi:hypothetical protein
MIYIVAIIGIACGFLIPRRRRAVAALLFLGVFALLGGIGLSLIFSYSAEQLKGILTLASELKFDPIGFLPLIGVAYTLLVGAFVGAIRLLSKNK